MSSWSCIYMVYGLFALVDMEDISLFSLYVPFANSG